MEDARCRGLPSAGRRRRSGQRHDPCTHLTRNRPRPTRRRATLQSRYPLLSIAIKPLIHRRLRRPGLLCDLGHRVPLVIPQHDLRTPRHRAIVDIGMQPRPQLAPRLVRKSHGAIFPQTQEQVNFIQLRGTRRQLNYSAMHPIYVAIRQFYCRKIHPEGPWVNDRKGQ